MQHLYVGARDESANVYFDVTETVSTKLKALKAHKSQMQNIDNTFDERIKNWLRMPGEKGIPLELAESFRYFFLG